MCKGIYDSREKDYTNPFRKMVYDTKEEMNQVVGKIEGNTFIQQEFAQCDEITKQVRSIIRKMKL